MRTRELGGSEYGRWVEVVDLRAELQLPRCPGCRDGHLVARSGPHGAFHGCTNFPHCLQKHGWMRGTVAFVGDPTEPDDVWSLGNSLFPRA